MNAKRFLVLVLLSRAACAQWTPIPGPGGGGVGALASADGRICAGTADGIYCSGTETDAWRAAGFQGRQVRDLAMTRSGWAAITEQSDSVTAEVFFDLHVSVDGGAHATTFERVPDQYRFNLQAYGDSLLCLRGPSARPILFSPNGGRTWDSLDAPVSGASECTLAADYLLCAGDSAVYAKGKSDSAWRRVADGSSMYLTGGKAYVRMDGGLARVGPGGVEAGMPRPVPLGSLVLASDSLCAIKTVEGVYFSVPGGAAWTLAPPSPNTTTFLTGPGAWSQGAGFIMSQGGAMRARRDGSGIAFTPFGRGLPGGKIRFESKGGNLYSISLDGIYRRGTDGEWVPVFRSGSTLWFSWLEPGIGMAVSLNSKDFPALFSFDDGLAWSAPPQGLNGNIGSLAKAGGAYVALGRLWGSEEYWIATSPSMRGPWTSRPWSPPESRCIYGLQASGSRLLLPCGEVLLRSGDMGEHWDTLAFEERGQLAVNGERALFWGRQVRESVDGGGTWKQVQAPWPAGYTLHSLALSGPDALVLAREDAGQRSLRIYPLPGSDPKWNSLAGAAIPGDASNLCIHEGRLWAGREAMGGYLYDGSLSIPKRTSPRRYAAFPRERVWRGRDARGRASASRRNL